MLTQMEVFCDGIQTPPFAIVDQAPAKDLIQIKNIDGLGPVKASVNTTQYGSIDGELYDGSFTPKRNIVITVTLNPDWINYTYEDLRQILYSYFMPENEVRLRFTSTHLAPVEISGIVEAFEPPLFAKDAEYQISVICPQPYFLALDMTVIPGTTQDFATPVDEVINYEGTAPTGFVVDITVPSSAADFTGEVRLISKTPTTKLMIIEPVTVSTDEFFRWSSVQRDKYARQYPLTGGAALPIDILGAVSPGSEWLKLRQGANRLQILTEVAGLSWTVSYYAKYGGL